MIQFFYIFFSLTLLFSQSFFDVYKSDLPKSVLEGKHKIGNIEELVNEYAEISPILVYVYIENLEKINSKQKTEFNLTQLKDILLSIRKEWVKSILKDKSLSTKTQIALTDLYSTYSFSEIHAATIDLDRYKQNSKFLYILAKHVSGEDFGSFNTSINYEYIVSTEIIKKVEKLNFNFEELKRNQGRTVINISPFLYLLHSNPIQFTKNTTPFSVADYLERVEQVKEEALKQKFSYYKKNKMKKSYVRVLSGSSILAFVKPEDEENIISNELFVKQFQYEFRVFTDESRFFIPYISFYLGANIETGSDLKSELTMYRLVYEGERVSIPPKGTDDSEYATERTFLKARHFELVNFLSLDYGLSIPLKVSSLGWREKPEFFTLEANAGFRYISYNYKSSSDFEVKDWREVTNVIYVTSRGYGPIKRSFTTKETMAKFNETNFVYGLSVQLRPFKDFAISYYYFAESSSIGLGYGF